MLPVGAMLLAASVSGWAQNAPVTTTLGTVTVTEKAEAQQGKDALQTKQTTIGKGNQDIRDIPQSITVVTEKLLDDVKLDTLRDALHYTAGITFAATENGTDQDIRLRGFPIATTGDLMIDGMRDPSQYDRDTFNYDRVEIMRGSASMLFGRGSTGGVVNQVSKKPFLVDQNEISSTIGTGGYFRTTGDFNIVTGESAALRMNAMYNTANNGGAKIDKYGFAPTYSWGIGTRDEFNVGLFYLNNDNKPMSALRWLGNGAGTIGTVPDIKPGNYYGSSSDYVTGEATYVSGSNLHRFDDGGQLKTQIRTGVFDRSQWSTAGAFATGTTISNLNPNTVITRQGLTPRKDQYKGTYFQSDYTNKFDWFGVKNDVIAGIDGAKEQANRYGAGNGIGANYNKGTTTVGNDGAVAYTAISPVYRETSAYSAKAVGAFLQDVIQIAPSWKVLAGVRYDYFSGRFQQRTYNAAGAVATVPNASLSDSPFSYRTGLIYQPSATQSYHVSYGTSFNTSADTYQYTNATNANTPPEKSRNIEVGAKLDWMDGRLSTRGAIFRTEKYNERTTDADFASNSYLLSGARHTQGVELDVVGKLTSQLEVYLSYAWTPTAEIDKAGSTAQATVGQRVGLTPKHSFATWLGYQVDPKLRIAAGVRGASTNYALAGTSGAAQMTNHAPGYAAIDALVEYKMSEDLLLQFNIKNLANKLYGDQLYPAFVISGAPRTALLTATYKF